MLAPIAYAPPHLVARSNQVTSQHQCRRLSHLSTIPRAYSVGQIGEGVSPEIESVCLQNELFFPSHTCILNQIVASILYLLLLLESGIWSPRNEC